MKAPFTRLALLTVFLIAVAYAFAAFPKGMHAWQEKQRQIQEKEKSNTILVQEVERKKERIHRLDTDPEQQELEIRKRLKLARPDEKIFITGETEKAPAEGCLAYRKAVELQPDDLVAQLGEARCLIRTARWGEARGLLEGALKLDPSHLQARILLAETYFAEGTPDAVRWARREMESAGEVGTTAVLAMVSVDDDGAIAQTRAKIQRLVDFQIFPHLMEVAGLGADGSGEMTDVILQSVAAAGTPADCAAAVEGWASAGATEIVLVAGDEEPRES